MDRFDDAWDYDEEIDAALGPELDPDADPEELYLRLISEEERTRFWSESVWTCDPAEEVVVDSLLFIDRAAEAELCKEIRLSQLWDQCQRGSLPMVEFLELATLVTEVEGVRGSLCIDCAMLGRPNVSANWALGATFLCRGHLRFRLGHARIERSP